MRVIVSGDVFKLAQVKGEGPKLHELFKFACDGRHVVFFSSSLYLESWFAQLPPLERENYEDVINLSERVANIFPEDQVTVSVTLDGNPCWNYPAVELPIDDALKLLRKPLKIILENKENDWNFLLGIMTKSERDLVDPFVEKEWIEPMHGGGDTIKKEIKRILNDNYERLRTFIVFDSDRRHPDELLNDWKPEKERDCAGFGYEKLVRSESSIGYWMLKRRFIESYIPKDRLENIKSGNVPRETIDAFFRLSKRGQWYYNMKHGFSRDCLKGGFVRSKDLYDDVTEEDIDALSKGMHESLAKDYANAVKEPFNWDDDARKEAAEALPRLLRLL